MKNTTIALSAMTALAIVAGSASAAQTMQTQNFGAATPNFNQTVSFDKFDGTLGTLNSVKIKVQLAIEGGFLQLDNDGELPASGSAQLGANASISSLDVPVLDMSFQNVLGSGVPVFNASPFNIMGNDGDNTSTFDVGTADYFDFQGTPNSDMGMGFINALFHAAYTDINGIVSGLETYGIRVDVDQIFNYGSIGGIQFTGGPVTASGNVMVTYDYTPVPAPGAAALLGLGGLTLVRRRR